MLKFKDAVVRSRRVLEDVEQVEPQSVRFEGAELSDDERYWQITFSYWHPNREEDRSLNLASDLFRKHTTIKLRAQDGELFGVKNVAA